jgi:hypothetical protein
MMDFRAYPEAIAALSRDVLSIELQVEQMAAFVKSVEAEADLQVSFDSDLKNDNQRKAKKKQILDEHSQYWEYSECLKSYKFDREVKLIELELRKNEFSILKLEKREFIARCEIA